MSRKTNVEEWQDLFKLSSTKQREKNVSSTGDSGKPSSSASSGKLIEEVSIGKKAEEEAVVLKVAAGITTPVGKKLATPYSGKEEEAGKRDRSGEISEGQMRKYHHTDAFYSDEDDSLGDPVLEDISQVDSALAAKVRELEDVIKSQDEKIKYLDRVIQDQDSRIWQHHKDLSELRNSIKELTKSLGAAEYRDALLKEDIEVLKTRIRPSSPRNPVVPTTPVPTTPVRAPSQTVKGCMTPSPDPFRALPQIVSTPVKSSAAFAAPVYTPVGAAGVSTSAPASAPSSTPSLPASVPVSAPVSTPAPSQGLSDASGVKASIEASSPPRSSPSVPAPTTPSGGLAGSPASAPKEEAAWTEARTKRVRKSLKERLKELDGEAVRNLVGQKPRTEERAKSVSTLAAYFKMNKEARKTPMACWKAVVRSCNCPRPVWFSMINSSTMELYFEDKDVAAAEAALRREGVLVEGYRPTMKDVFRRTRVYLKSYFRPLRQAALHGLDREIVSEILRMAAESAVKLTDKSARKQQLYQIGIDKGLLSEDCPMDEGVPPGTS